ncbi:MAG: hypothetical protein EA416_11295 [Trueperaceae bacterium]|nr:MAG: hypothetical protein EA416_11295 [Trueperaceae bacterium]
MFERYDHPEFPPAWLAWQDLELTDVEAKELRRELIAIVRRMSGTLRPGASRRTYLLHVGLAPAQRNGRIAPRGPVRDPPRRNAHLCSIVAARDADVPTLAGEIAAYVPIPAPLHFSISAMAALILAYLGPLVMLAPKP